MATYRMTTDTCLVLAFKKMTDLHYGIVYEKWLVIIKGRAHPAL